MKDVDKKYLTTKEYENEFPDNMVYYQGEYYDDLYDFVKNFDYDEIGYELYGTMLCKSHIDAREIIEDMIENSNVEDAEVDSEGYHDLEKYLIYWNDKYGIPYFEVNEEVVILFDEKDFNFYDTL